MRFSCLFMRFFSVQYVFYLFCKRPFLVYYKLFLYSAMTFSDTFSAIRFLLRTFLSTLLAFLIMGYALFIIFIVLGLFVHYAV